GTFSRIGGWLLKVRLNRILSDIVFDQSTKSGYWLSGTAAVVGFLNCGETTTEKRNFGPLIPFGRIVQTRFCSGLAIGLLSECQTVVPPFFGGHELSRCGK